MKTNSDQVKTNSDQVNTEKPKKEPVAKTKKETIYCPKCLAPMRRISTGSRVVTYQCTVCKNIKIVDREIKDGNS